jgi:hypothetical protein
MAEPLEMVGRVETVALVETEAQPELVGVGVRRLTQRPHLLGFQRPPQVLGQGVLAAQLEVRFPHLQPIQQAGILGEREILAP